MNPLFFTSKTIVHKKIDDSKIIKTGFTELDGMIRGLIKQEITCVSGLNGSGKSSVLSQVALEVVQSGHKVALFSGELSESRVLDWLQLQAAGKYHTMGTQYENYYYVKDEVKQDINTWLDQKLFVYNNDYGNKSTDVLTAIEDCITRKKVDVVILDNLMSLDLGSSQDKWENQSIFIKAVKRFAVINDVHIMLVMHPRKSIGFLRKDDISGTADLTNMVDNVFIIHRVNEDFRRLSKQTFGWKEEKAIYDCSNVIEVCKNRDLGIQDKFIGLFYEKESKRFKNSVDECKSYGWEPRVSVEQSPFDL